MNDLRAAIESRHSKDLIVPECKDGPTWGGGHLRLDYWVLKRSWSNPAMIGYEVKSSRADWLKDTKWTGYLPLCNELWFIADPKHVRPGELPEGVGHLRLAGSRLITVKRAAWREIEPPFALLTYILMCRTAIKGEYLTDKSDRLEEWRSWLARSEDKREVGRNVGRALREKYEREVASVRKRNEELAKEIERLSEFRAALEAKGVRWSLWTSPQDVVEQVSVPKWSRSEIEHAHATLGRLLNGKD